MFKFYIPLLVLLLSHAENSTAQAESYVKVTLEKDGEDTKKEIVYLNMRPFAAILTILICALTGFIFIAPSPFSMVIATFGSLIIIALYECLVFSLRRATYLYPFHSFIEETEGIDEALVKAIFLKFTRIGGAVGVVLVILFIEFIFRDKISIATFIIIFVVGLSASLIIIGLYEYIVSLLISKEEEGEKVVPASTNKT